MNKKWINRDKLHKRGRCILWEKCVGQSFEFVFNEISGEIFVDAFENERLHLVYGQRDKWITTGGFLKVQISDLIAYRGFESQYRMNLQQYCDEHNEMGYLLEEWDYVKNDKTPADYSRGCDEDVFWICRNCGYSWSAKINKRVGLIENGKIKRKPQGCLACTNVVVWSGHNDFKTLYPDLANEWDYEKNFPARPENFVPGCNTYFNWICKNDSEHRWSQSINTRTNGVGCKICAARKRGDALRINALANGNTLAEKFPGIAEEWDNEKNGEWTPNDYAPNANEKVWWKCRKCGYQWSDIIANRTRNNRKCERCYNDNQTSGAEQIIFHYLKRVVNSAVSGYRDTRINPYSLDIFIPEYNLGVEYDGEAWHKEPQKDENKTIFLQKKGIRVIRIREPKCPKLCDGIETLITSIPNYSTYNYLNKIIKELYVILETYIGETIDIIPNVSRDRLEILAEYKKIKEENTFATERPELCNEWHPTKNNGLTPDMFKPQSNQSVWWVCSTCGYEYQKEIYNRYNGQGCGVCSGKILWKGHNDFASRCPELLEEWNYIRNDSISPDELKLGDCDTEVWWICKECGNEWHASIYNRVHLHSGCRKCSSKRGAKITAKKISKKVICETTGERFDSLTEAGLKYNVGKSDISKCCKGKASFAGRLRDGTKLKWSYDENP